MENSEQNGSNKDSIMHRDSYHSSGTGDFANFRSDNESEAEELNKQ